MAEKELGEYEVVTPVPGYYTSKNAISGTDRRNTVRPAKYFIYNEANGAINVTSVKGVPGSWINPEDNTKPENVVTDTQSEDSSSISSVDQSNNAKKTLDYGDSVTPALSTSSGSNKRVYSPTKDYIPCYIINSLTGGTIEFECEPEEITDNNSAQYDAQEVRGRSSPYQGYNQSGPREINFSVMLHDDLCKNGILATVNHLKSLTYPGYDGVLSAPHCVIRIGDMIHCNAIISDVGVTWQKPFRDGVYVAATVDISGLEVVDSAYSASEIWSKGGYI